MSTPVTTPAALPATIPATTTAAVAEPLSSRHVAHLMGMPVVLALRGRHACDAAGAEAWGRVVRWLDRVDRMFSTYRADSAVLRFDRGDLSLAAGPPELAEVLTLAEQAQERTAGWFSVWLPDPVAGGVRFDPSGLVKGWAVERAAAHLNLLPDTDFCLSAGGDLTCRTGRAEDRPWRIGIEDPADPRRSLAVVPLLGGACATSGDAHRGAHVVDPHTGRPAPAGGSVTVLSASLLWADVWATAAYAQGDRAAAVLAGSGHDGLVVTAAGEVHAVGRATVPA